MRTSTVLTPYSCAARPAFSAATCAANGVDLRETAEARAAGGRPRQCVALAIGDRHDGIVERSLHVHDAVSDDALGFLLGLGSNDRFVHESGIPENYFGGSD
jgi:hypothetical protein